MRAGVRAVAAVIAGAVTVAGCTAAGDTAARGAAISSESAEPPRATGTQSAAVELDTSTPVRVQWQHQGQFAGPVWITDGVVTARDFEHSPDTLHGFDLFTGEPLWDRASSRGAVVAGHRSNGTSVEASDGTLTLINIAPLDFETGTHMLELVDPRTGELVAPAWTGWVATSEKCDGADGVCVSVNKASGADAEFYDLRVDPETLAIEPYAADGVHEGVEEIRDLSDGMAVELGTDGTEWIVRRAENGAVTWELPVATLGEGSLLSALATNQVVTAEAGDALLLSAALTPGIDDDGNVAAADFTSVSIDTSTGEVLYVRGGAVWCGEALLCGEGMVIEERSAGEWEYGTGDMKLTGVDPRTGAERWGRTAADFALSASNDAGVGLVSPEGSMMVREGGDVGSLDTATGVLTPIDAGTVACTRPLMTRDLEYDRMAGGQEEVLSGTTYYPCDTTGAESDLWSRGAVEAAGTIGEAGGRRIAVVAQDDALVAYDLGPADAEDVADDVAE